MKIECSLIPETFVERLNRFIVLVSIDSDIQRSHLPDPSRLKGLLVSGADFVVRQSPKDLSIKTRCATVIVNHDGQLISLVLIGFDSIAFRWLCRTGEIMTVLISYQVVYEREVYQLREILWVR